MNDHDSRGETTPHPAITEDVPATICPAEKEAAAFTVADMAAWKWVAPLLVYMALPMFLERFGLMSTSQLQFAGPRPPGADWGGLTVLMIQVFVVGGLLLYLAPAYLRLLPWRVTWMAVPLGLLGLALWVGICELHVEKSILNLIPSLAFLEAARPSINPAESYPESVPYWSFMLFRFLALAIVVPVAEEVLLRGYFLRMIQEDDWWRLPMNRLALSAIAVSAIYGALTHPNEWLAAIVWFAAVTWWIRWTNRFWDGVVIHAVTNLALGIYVMMYQQWHLW